MIVLNSVRIHNLTKPKPKTFVLRYDCQDPCEVTNDRRGTRIQLVADKHQPESDTLGAYREQFAEYHSSDPVSQLNDAFALQTLLLRLRFLDATR